MKIILDHITILPSHGMPLCFYGRDLSATQRTAICRALSTVFQTSVFSSDTADECLRTIVDLLTTVRFDPSNPEIHIQLIIK